MDVCVRWCWMTWICIIQNIRINKVVLNSKFWTIFHHLIRDIYVIFWLKINGVIFTIRLCIFASNENEI